MKATIPQYSEQQATLYSQQKKTALKQIARYHAISGVTGEDALRQQYGAIIQQFLQQAEWKSRQQDALQHTEPEHKAALQQAVDSGSLDAVATDTVIALTHADRISTRIKEGPFYKKGITGDLEQYKRLITQESLSQMKSLGVSDRSALSLFGQTVRMGMDLSSSPGQYEIKPKFDPTVPAEKMIAAIFAADRTP